jgi:hypothetical protein
VYQPIFFPLCIKTLGFTDDRQVLGLAFRMRHYVWISRIFARNCNSLSLVCIKCNIKMHGCFVCLSENASFKTKWNIQYIYPVLSRDPAVFLRVVQSNTAHDSSDHSVTRDTDRDEWRKSRPLYPLVTFAPIYLLGYHVVLVTDSIARVHKWISAESFHTDICFLCVIVYVGECSVRRYMILGTFAMAVISWQVYLSE